MLKISTKIKKTLNFLNRIDGTLKNRVFRAGFWVFFSSSLLILLSLARNIILARLLFPEIFGLMGICLMVLRGVELFTETGFAAALIHRQENYEEAKETAFTLIVIRGFFLTLLLFAFSPFIASYYGKIELSALIKVLALTIVFKSFGNINIITNQKNLDFKKITLFQQFISVLDFSITITLAFFLKNIWALVIGQVITSILGAALSYFFIPGRLKFYFDKNIAKSLFGYGKYVTGITIVLFTASEIDNAFIGKILGMDMLGYYVIAYSLANLPATHISKIASRIMFPAYSSIQNNLPVLQEAYFNVFKLLSKITIPSAMGLAVLAPEIISIVYGQKWMPAVTSLQILCIFGCCRSVLATNGYLFNAIGKPYITFYIGSVRLILIMLLIYPLTKTYGLVGASLSVTLPILVQLVLSSIIMSRVLRFKLIMTIKTLVITLMQSLVMGSLVLVIKKSFADIDGFHLVFIIVVGIIIYMIMNLFYIKSIINKI